MFLNYYLYELIYITIDMQFTINNSWVLLICACFGNSSKVDLIMRILKKYYVYAYEIDRINVKASHKSFFW